MGGFSAVTGDLTFVQAVIWGKMALLAGMATAGIALQEWNVSQKRRWFLLEGLFGILAGLTVVFFAPSGGNSSTFINLCGIFWLCWLITTSIVAIIASNGWALQVGGILTLLELAYIFALIVAIPAPSPALVDGYFVLFG